jgi:hypothetical protein
MTQQPLAGQDLLNIAAARLLCTSDQLVAEAST